MDWFERLTGFKEAGYEETRSSLAVEGSHLVSLTSGQRHGIGELELPSLAELRARVASGDRSVGTPSVRCVYGDVRRLHQRPEFERALFQVASQFNLLEMTSPGVTPEDGVTRYQEDDTQGPACAMAAGAATIYRNYFVPVEGQIGQTHSRQLDALAELGDVLARKLGQPVDRLWSMRNGYACCTPSGIDLIEALLSRADEGQLDALRARLRIGLHWNVEVTDGPGAYRPIVTQAFCSALPIAYTDIPAPRWEAFARLVLEAAYEATLLAGVVNAMRGGSNRVLLTRLGGGAFGNPGHWIDEAIGRALDRVGKCGLEIRIVSLGAPSAALRALERRAARTSGRIEPGHCDS